VNTFLTVHTHEPVARSNQADDLQFFKKQIIPLSVMIKALFHEESFRLAAALARISWKVFSHALGVPAKDPSWDRAFVRTNLPLSIMARARFLKLMLGLTSLCLCS
jgi:hypothetical protein